MPPPRVPAIIQGRQATAGGRRRVGYLIGSQLLTYWTGGFTQARFDQVLNYFDAQTGAATGLVLPAQTCNPYDAELYQWIKYRSAAQRLLFEPQLSDDLESFRKVNGALTSFGKFFPYKVRKKLAEVCLYNWPWKSANSHSAQTASPDVLSQPWTPLVDCSDSGDEVRIRSNSWWSWLQRP
jgi:hypothetical protein